MLNYSEPRITQIRSEMVLLELNIDSMSINWS